MGWSPFWTIDDNCTCLGYNGAWSVQSESSHAMTMTAPRVGGRTIAFLRFIVLLAALSTQWGTA